MNWPPGARRIVRSQPPNWSLAKKPSRINRPDVTSSSELRMKVPFDCDMPDFSSDTVLFVRSP